MRFTFFLNFARLVSVRRSTIQELLDETYLYIKDK